MLFLISVGNDYSDINDSQSFKGLAVMLKSKNNRFGGIQEVRINILLVYFET